MNITLEQALLGIADAEQHLASREAIVSPSIISQQMYRLGQYTSALEKILGDCEAEYEKKWATQYSMYTEPYTVVDKNGKESKAKSMSATAAENRANIDCAADKGNLKRLKRYVDSSWKNQTGAMARINHLIAEHKSGGI